VYDAIYARSKSKFDALKTEGALLCNYACVLEMLLRLRQVVGLLALLVQKKKY
jgi:hypothetical protein